MPVFTNGWLCSVCRNHQAQLPLQDVYSLRLLRYSDPPVLPSPVSCSAIYNTPTSSIQMYKVVMLRFQAGAGAASSLESTAHPLPAFLHVCLSFFHSLTKLGRVWHTVITDCPVFLQVVYLRNLIEKHLKGHSPSDFQATNK